MSEKPQYYSTLTEAGAALDAAARVSGTPVRLTHIAVGDGAGDVPDPDPQATSLRREICRRPVERIFVDPDNPCLFWLELTLPTDVGGFWIREIGILAATDEGMVLFAVGSHAPYYKAKLDSGLASEHTIRIGITVSSEAVVEMRVSSAVYVTREELEALREELLAGLAAATDLHAAVAGLQEQVARLASRLTACQIGQARTIATPAAPSGSAGSGSSGALDPAGETIAPGVTVAPLTLVTAGGHAPRRAALAVLLDEHQPLTTE